ncbi:hypothetical protein NLI96_g7061 [Meripilus lineatus]|uniref:laccase n=1 Tax=Meripilus lineatus TaxID=2056292 RepID=A0AAD5V4L0_9APHY|nr:hypothetical protein NLI96_g7061 [Physisporinus lineatus]
MGFSRSLTVIVLLFFELAFSGQAATIGPVADLHITNAVISPDGHNRTAILAGGSYPGPLIRANKGDNFQINVINELTDEEMMTSTSVHWHGLFQAGTNWADGGVSVNQCPITPGTSFLYDFKAGTQAGTFLYHSHTSTQYCNGLVGPLVVYDPHDPHRYLYDVDDESTILSLSEWYHSPPSPHGKPPSPDSTLINGLGRYSEGPKSPLTVITVKRGKRYRFRLISMACHPTYQFNIDNHYMKVIEVEGTNSIPLPVDNIEIWPGQRYSFVVHANQPVGNYWIRAKPNYGNDTYIGGLNSAILRYVGAPEEEPTTVQTGGHNTLQESHLHPLVPKPVPGLPFPGGVDYALNLAFSFDKGLFYVNGATFVPPSVPALLQIFSGTRNAQDLLPSNSVYSLPPNATIEITMPGIAGGGHPMHLHGHNFWVVQSAQSLPNYVNPILRDVVDIGGVGDNVTIRFQTNNPGPWFLHCHIDFHLVGGMAIVLAEDINGTAAANPAPVEWEQMCQF